MFTRRRMKCVLTWQRCSGKLNLKKIVYKIFKYIYYVEESLNIIHIYINLFAYKYVSNIHRIPFTSVHNFCKNYTKLEISLQTKFCTVRQTLLTEFQVQLLQSILFFFVILSVQHLHLNRLQF